MPIITYFLNFSGIRSLVISPKSFLLAINQDCWDSMLVSNNGSRSPYFPSLCFIIWFIGLNIIYRMSSVKDVNLRISKSFGLFDLKIPYLFYRLKCLSIFTKGRNHFTKIGMIVINPVLICSYDKGRKILFNILINIEITNDCQSLTDYFLKIPYI